MVGYYEDDNDSGGGDEEWIRRTRRHAECHAAVGLSTLMSRTVLLCIVLNVTPRKPRHSHHHTTTFTTALIPKRAMRSNSYSWMASNSARRMQGAQDAHNPQKQTTNARLAKPFEDHTSPRSVAARSMWMLPCLWMCVCIYLDCITYANTPIENPSARRREGVRRHIHRISFQSEPGKRLAPFASSAIVAQKYVFDASRRWSR